MLRQIRSEQNGSSPLLALIFLGYPDTVWNVASILILTPFEEQVLQMMGHAADELSGPFFGLMSSTVAATGVAQFGEGWGGSRRGDAYPVLSAAFGRLRNKGLVHREVDEYPDSWGFWALTPAGAELLGLA